jgi:hypothetical protein
MEYAPLVDVIHLYVMNVRCVLWIMFTPLVGWCDTSICRVFAKNSSKAFVFSTMCNSLEQFFVCV